MPNGTIFATSGNRYSHIKCERKQIKNIIYLCILNFHLSTLTFQLVHRSHVVFDTALRYSKKNAIAANASLLRCFCHNFLLYQKERTRKEDKIKYPVHVVFDTALCYSKNNAIAAYASLLRCFCHNFLLYQKERTRKEDKIKYPVHVVFDTALCYSKNNAIAAYASLLRCFCHNFLLYQK